MTREKRERERQTDRQTDRETERDMVVMLKHKCLLLKNPFFLQFCLVLSLCVLKKATKENSDFLIFENIESPKS